MKLIGEDTAAIRAAKVTQRRPPIAVSVGHYGLDLELHYRAGAQVIKQLPDHELGQPAASRAYDNGLHSSDDTRPQPPVHIDLSV